LCYFFATMKNNDATLVTSFRLQWGILALLLLFSQLVLAQKKNLDYYLKQGFANSPLIKDYQNQVAAGELDRKRLKATYAPQVTATSNNNVSPLINGYGYDVALSNQQSFNELLNVNQTFIGRNNLNAQYQSVRLVSDSIANGQKVSEQDLRRSIVAQYITAYGDLQQLNFYSEVNTILSNQEIILKKLTQSNVYRQTDYLTFLVTKKQQELQMKQLQIQFRTDVATLNYLCGIFDTSTATLDSPDINVQSLTDPSASAFFLRYKIDSIRLANEMLLIKYNYRPKVTAYVNGGYSSTLLYEPYKNFGVGGGLNVNVPIYDGHQRQLQETKIHLLENTNQNYKNFFTTQYTQQTTMLRQQLMATESLIADINEQIKFAEGLINVNGKLLQTGDAKIVDFVIAINNFLTAKNLLTQNTIGRLQIVNQLNYWNR
jgi:hypothetical protein